eukprot:UN00715
MGLVELKRRNILKYLISQNCDGLHRRSGIKSGDISELHGNGNIEICEVCGTKFFRDCHTSRVKRGRDHFTGRFCTRENCDGRLLNSTIDFGQNLPEQPLEFAEQHSNKADLHVVFGSSLTVNPACSLPETTGRKNNGTLVIVNLQKTPLTDLADTHIFAKTDVVMRMLIEKFKYTNS